MFESLWAMHELIKRDGANEGDDDANSGVILGDELPITNNENIEFTVASASPFRNQIATPLGTDSDGDFLEGEMFFKRGLYKFTLSVRQTNDKGNYDIIIGGVKVFSQAVGFNASTTQVAFTSTAFLEGGKSLVRFAINGKEGGSGAFRFLINSLTYTLVSGKSNGDEVNVWYADDDGQTVSGEDSVITSNQDDARFNGIRQVNTDVPDDEIVFSRYFSGGTYKFKYLYVNGASGGFTDILVGSTVVLANVNQFNASTQFNQEAFATVTIPRGFQDISIKNVADGGSSDFRYTFTRLQFTKIADIESAEDDNSDGVHGALIPLAKYTEVLVTSNDDVLLNLGGVDMQKKFSELQITFGLNSTGAGAFNLEINSLTVNSYKRLGNFSSPTTVTALNDTATSIPIASQDLIPGAEYVFGKLTLKLTTSKIGGNERIGGEGKSVSSPQGVEDYGWFLNDDFDLPAVIESLRFFMTSTAWRNGMTIDVYGVLR